MRTLIVLKEKENETPRIAKRLLSRGEDVALVMMLDAVYLAATMDDCPPLEELTEKGVNAFVLKSDVERRGLGDRLLPGVVQVDYEGLIDLLFTPDQRVLNL